MTIERAFTDGLRLARAGRYFEAHEAFEEAWRAAAHGERDFFQGLVHVVVAWYQDGRGNVVGCRRQLEKAAMRLRAFTPAHRGVDVARLLAQLERVEPPSLPRLDLPEAEPVEESP